MFEDFFTRLQNWISRTNRRNVSTDAREIYVNQSLPQSLLDPKTGFPLTKYPRNKIRTTKYTPLNFLPLNILFQFTNIANSYFLLIIILGCFQIFGVQSPGMQAVPLIVIVVLTAIKDGLEDSRRAISDFEMNSSKVHLLDGILNANVIEDNVGPWRRFKKNCSKLTAPMLSFIVKNKRVENEHNENVDSYVSGDLGSVITPIISKSSLFTSNTKKSERKNTRLSEFSPNSLCDPHMNLSFGLRFKSAQWKSVNVGDILKINKNEEIPSDVVVLNTSSDDGISYVETKNLDGETNLKSKKALKCGHCIRTVADIERAVFTIGSEPPSMDLYSYRGVIKYTGFSSADDHEGVEMHEPITIDNVLLRGSVLRNTKYAICVVVATGDDTKIIMNSGVTPTKKSKISSDLNTYVIFNFVLLFIMCFVAGLVNGLFYRPSNETSRKFFEYKPYVSTAAANGVLSFFVNLIQYQTLVPISLYITVEIIKTLQAFFIYSDTQMYYEKLDFPCIPKSWGISDDLGQVEYVFSDKTGTLTQNIMEFKKCFIGNQMYGLSYTAAQEGIDRRNHVPNIEGKKRDLELQVAEDKQKMESILTKLNKYFEPQNLTFVSSNFMQDFQNFNAELVTAQSLENHDFMLALALCHTAVIEKYNFDENENDENAENHISYSAESPDEVALVSTARDMGLVFLGKNGDDYQVYDSTIDSVLNFKVLCVFPFDSTRKRMSIVLRNSSNEIIMLTKGADNVILERCQNSSHIDHVKESLTQLSEEGLRTLCVARKYIGEAEFRKWHDQYLHASALLDESREDKMNELADSLERGFRIIGSTGIEDKLQDGVPATIASIRKAGIKFWMLTGDKVETAISIGFSCSMLDNKMDLTILQDIDTTDELNQVLDNVLNEKFNLDPNDPKTLRWLKNDHSIPPETHSLIIDGKTLTTLFDEQTTDDVRRKFLLLCKCCCSVLCCRVSPAQKAEIVLLVKKTIDIITLAIGDGANDVSMIQAANVGVGIAGEEGRTAVMSSDYAIGQFRYLQRLLLVHGRWSFNRLSEVIPCFFYKNVIFVMPLFWYGIFTDFDGTYLYEYSLLMLFNLFFTSAPVVTMGCLDQDVPDYVSLAIPQLYRAGILRQGHPFLKFVIYMIDGIYQSVLCFFWPWLIFHAADFASHTGLVMNDRFSFGNFSAVSSIFACDTFVLLRQKRWDVVSIGFYLLSIALTVIWIAGYSSNTFSFNYYYTGINCFRSASFWASVFLALLAAMLPRFAYDIIKVNFFPSDIDIVRKKLNISMFENRERDLEGDLEIALSIANNYNEKNTTEELEIDEKRA